MLTYYPSLQAIDQHSRQLGGITCRHCGKTCHLLSHGFVRKKQHGGEPLAVGKRVYCSNRHAHTGCGRTFRLYLENTLRRLHATADQMNAFVLALVTGMAVAHAYRAATGGPARNAWRWLNRMRARLTTWRSLAHRPPLPAAGAQPVAPGYRQQTVLRSTLAAACAGHAGVALCRTFQRVEQQSFI